MSVGEFSTSSSLLGRLHAPGDGSVQARELRRIAWNRFVELYVPFLYRYARRLGSNVQAAEDLVQDVLQTIADPARFRHDPARRFRGYLRTVLLNRHRALNRGGDARRLEHRADIEAPDSDDDIARIAEAEHDQYVCARMAQLVCAQFPQYQELYNLLICQGRPAADVARACGLSERTVYRARQEILSCIRRELGDMLD